MNFGVLNDYSEPAADRFPVQVLKQQAIVGDAAGQLEFPWEHHQSKTKSGG